MAITLGALALPDGLIWTDEYAWTPVAQATTYTLTGALVVEDAEKQAGRPITLAGAQDGNDYSAWMTRTQLEALKTALDAAGATFTLTLHDARTFTVTPRRDGDGPLSVTPLAVYKTFPPANPAAGRNYAINEIRLMEV